MIVFYANSFLFVTVINFT